MTHAPKSLVSATVAALLALSAASGMAVANDAAGAQAQSGAVSQSDGSAASSAPTIQLQEVVVTAEKVKEPLQKVPVAITALPASTLQARGITNIDQLSAQVPNLNFMTSTGQTADQQAFVFIRGIGQSQFFINTDPGVGMYVDGVYIGRSQGALFDVLDLERIEVLRGPQGTLYGRNTIGGAINIITQPPSADTYTRVELGYGNYNQVTAKVVSDQALSSNVFGSIALERTSHDGYVQPIIDPTCPTCNRQALTNDDTWGGRLALRALASDNVTVDWTLDFTNRHDLPQGLRLSYYNPNPPPPFNFFAFPLTMVHGKPPGAYVDTTYNTSEMQYAGYDHENTYGSALTVTVQTSLGTLKSITAWRGLQVDDSDDGDGSPLAVYTNAWDTIHQTQYSQEFQLVSSLFDGHLELVSGLFGYTEKANETQATATFFADLMPCFNADAPPFWGCPAGDIDHYKYHVNNVAAYENATWHITKKLSFAAGIRYSTEHKSLGFVDDVNPQLDLDQAKTFVSWTPRVSLSYQVTPDMLLYTSYAEGYKSGNFNSGNFGPPYVQPETVKAYEAGIKSEWLQHILQVNVAGFYSDYDNMQLNITGNPPLHAFANAAKSNIDGFELETRANVSRFLHFDASTGYTHTKITRVAPGVTDITQGVPLPFVPQWTVNAGSDLLLPAGSAGRLDFRLDYQYLASQPGDANDTPVLITPSHGIFNLRGTFFSAGARDWQLYAYIDNLTDKRYAVATSSVLPSLFAIAVDGAPRTFGGGVRYRF